MVLRRQLSLYVPTAVGRDIEELRRLLDPVQSSLIAAHVTVAREDELANTSEDEIGERLRFSGRRATTLEFGIAEPFFEHGIILRCQGGEEEFQSLRRSIFGAKPMRTQHPHLTLAHPRNPKAPGNTLEAAFTLPKSLRITFPTISLIEQHGSTPWVVLREFKLRE